MFAPLSGINPVDYLDQLWNVLNGSGYEGTKDVD